MLFFVLHAMCALYPRTEKLPGLEDTNIEAFIRKFRRETTAAFWFGIVVSAWLFEWTPLFTVFVPLPAFLLPKKLLDKHAHKIASTELYLVRQAMLVLKMPAGLCWGADAEVRKRLGLGAFEPDPTTWKGKKAA
ncbi:MAG: hypothetical protein U0174_02990 [Polyangiaceae bacterium]